MSATIFNAHIMKHRVLRQNGTVVLHFYSHASERIVSAIYLSEMTAVDLAREILAVMEGPEPTPPPPDEPPEEPKP
jgi:hypothetical protein